METDVGKQFYADGLSTAVKETGTFAGEAAKTMRMVYQPLFTVLQRAGERLNEMVKEAFDAVPPERRKPAKPGILQAVAEAVAVEEDDSEMRAYYLKLLASMIDSECQGIVHPAFPKIVRELSPLDASLLQITPNDREGALPVGIDESSHMFGVGLFSVRDLKLKARRLVRPIKRCLRNPVNPNRNTDNGHAGLVEFVLPHALDSDSLAIGWANLQRLRLVRSHEVPQKAGVVAEPHWPGVSTIQHLKTLFGLDAYTFSTTRLYTRTELGQVFARCCVPGFTGKTEWYPMTRPQ